MTQDKDMSLALDIAVKALFDLYTLGEADVVKCIQRSDNIVCDAIDELREISIDNKELKNLINRARGKRGKQ